MKVKTILTRACIIIAIILVSYCTRAQQAEKFNSEKEKREVNGYTIRLVPLPVNTFGFFIMKGNKPVYSQLSDPFSHGPLGFKSKEDAYILAVWVVNEHSKNGRPPVTIPSSVAKQLNMQKGNVQQ